MTNPPGFEENTTVIELPADGADDLTIVRAFESLHRDRFAWSAGRWLANAGDHWDAPDAEAWLSLAIWNFVRGLEEAVAALPEGPRKAEWARALGRIHRLSTGPRGHFALDARTGLARPPDAFEADPTSRVRVSIGKHNQGAIRHTRYREVKPSRE